MQKNYIKASGALQKALEFTDDVELLGSLQHDLAILTERAGKRADALKWMEKSSSTFEKIPELRGRLP